MLQPVRPLHKQHGSKGFGAVPQVALFGACVTSWHHPALGEMLYVRPDAVWDRSRPIAGGIPVCFPQFGPGRLAQHGFARLTDWRLQASSAEGGYSGVTLLLKSDDATRAEW